MKFVILDPAVFMRDRLMKSVHQPCLAWIPIKGCFANSEDPDEISQIAIFHQGLHCLLRQTQSLVKEIHYYFKIITS